MTDVFDLPFIANLSRITRFDRKKFHKLVTSFIDSYPKEETLDSLSLSVQEF